MLTLKQSLLLDYMYDKQKQTGLIPCYSEMMDAMNLASKSGVHRLITGLEERGYIRRLPHRARAIEIIKRSNLPKPKSCCPHCGGKI